MKILGINNRVAFAIGSALFFSAIEIFLASTPAFIWVYKWWGAIPVFITTYIPFFLASYLIYDKEPQDAEEVDHLACMRQHRAACGAHPARRHLRRAGVALAALLMAAVFSACSPATEPAATDTPAAAQLTPSLLACAG